MPRVARTILPGVALHVVQRGNNRAPCFFTEGDRLAYLRLLLEYSRESRCAVHAYCLMTNHVHLLLTPEDSGACASLMKAVGQSYVQHVNKVHGRTGTLWEGRFKSSVALTPDYVLACYRYIEMNPVRAGLSSHPRGYRWSSYAFNAGGLPDSLLVPHACYKALESEVASRFEVYRNLFEVPLEGEVLTEIRNALRIGRQLGTECRRRGRPRKREEEKLNVPQSEK